MISCIALYVAILHYKQLTTEECLDIALCITSSRRKLPLTVKTITPDMLKEIVAGLDRITNIENLERKLKIDKRLMVKLYVICKLYEQEMVHKDYVDVIEMVTEGLSVYLLAQVAHAKDKNIARALQLLRR